MATGVRGTTVARLVGLALLFTVLGASAASAAQTTPQFLDRIFATGNANLDIDDTDDQRVDVDVAVFDTSLNLSDPDINVVGTTGCMHPDPDDENYVAPDTEDPDWHGDPANPGRGCMDNAATPYDHFHGTGTAQVAAAIDNDLDIVGVAPGARVWGVDVQRDPMFALAAAGHPEMDLYPVIAGVKWVTATRTDNDPDNDIEVVAMGWGCSTESDPTPLQPVCPYDDPDFADPIEQLEDAIANAVDEGVVFVAPAGNRDSDVSVFDSQTDPGTWIPASYDDVIGVSVLTDTDGLPGGLGPNSTAHCGGSTYTGTLTDDSFQNGSNWGAAIDIAAPSPSGCASGSAPLVAGAAAVLASADPPTSRSEVEDLTADLIDAGNLNWTDDSGDGVKEPLLDVGDEGVFDPALIHANTTRHVYYRSSDGQLREWWFSDTGEWNPVAHGPTDAMGGDPAAAVAANGRRYVFYRAANGQLSQDWFDDNGQSGHSGWGYANHVVGTPAVVIGATGRRHVYYRSSDGQLREWWFSDTGEWNPVAHGPTDAMAGDPTAVVTPDGRRYVFYRATNGQLHQYWFDDNGQSGHSGWGYAGQMEGTPAASISENGHRRWVFYQAANGQLTQWWFRDTGEWNPLQWGYANHVAGDPAVVTAVGGY